MTRAARRRAWRSKWSEVDWGEVMRRQAAAAASAPEMDRRTIWGYPIAYLVPALSIFAVTVVVAVWIVLR